MIDPNRLEEQVQAGNVIIAVNNYREICALTKAGGVALDMQRIVNCCEVASTKAAVLIETIQALLKEDVKQRESKQGGLMQRKK